MSWTEAWTVSNSWANVNGLFVDATGSRLGFLYTPDTQQLQGQHYVMVSQDGGVSFQQLTLATELQQFLSPNVLVSPTAFAMSQSADAFYLSGNVSGVKRVIRFSPVSSAGVWADLTGNYAHANQGFDNIGVISTITGESRNTWGTPDAFLAGAYSEDPVNLATGNFSHQHTDVLVPGRGHPLVFSRSYNSQDSSAGRLGYGWEDNYNMRLIFSETDHASSDVTVVHELGRQDDYLRNGDGTFARPPGVFDTLARNLSDGSFDLTRLDASKFHFDSNGLLLWMEGRNGSANRTNLIYKGGKLTRVTDPGGRMLTFSYQNPTFPDRITKVTDPLLRTVEFMYDATGDLTQVKDVKGGITVYAYSNHRMTSLMDANNHVAVQNTYDSLNRVVEQRDAVLGVTCIYYGRLPTNTSAACPAPTPAPAENQTILVDPRLNKTTHTFDASFRSVDVKDALTGVVHNDYDANDNLTCITDQRDKKTAYSYDSMGNVTQMIDAANTDANCQLKASGVKWTYAYTANNDIDLETDPLGRQTDNIYDSVGNLTRVARKDSGGAVKALTCFERDSFGQVNASVQSTDLQIPGSPTASCTGNRTLFGYDSYGNRTCVVNARFSATTTCASSTGPQKSFIYDLGGRLLFDTDELTNQQRPPVGNPESGVSQCGTAGTGNGVDNDGDSVADDGCPSTAYTHDAQNNVLTAVDGLGNTTTSTYDAKGTLKTVRDANSKLTTYNYDNADRPGRSHRRAEPEDFLRLRRERQPHFGDERQAAAGWCGGIGHAVRHFGHGERHGRRR